MKKIVVMLILGAALGCQNEKIEADCVEKPSDGRACTYDYRPVCGCNGVTYGNACAAESVGITNYTQGECRGK